MSKTKNYETSFAERCQQTAEKIGLVLMASAAVFGSVELTDSREKVVLNQSPLTLVPISNTISNPNDILRREKEDDSPLHYISYGTSLRTVSRTGKQ